MSGEEKTEELRQNKKTARQSGGPERIAARRRQGTGSARERVERLLDPDTFVELDVFVEGAVTGHGIVAGRDVYVFSQDADVAPGSLGWEYAQKIGKVMDLSLANGAPLVGIYDGTADVGLAGSPDGGSGLLLRSVLASGVVPQIAAVMGPVTGPAALAPALADLVVMVKGAGLMMLGGRTAEPGGNSESLGGARVLNEQDGAVQFAVDDEHKCLEMVRLLLSYLPQDNLDDVPLSDAVDAVDRMDDDLQVLAGAGSERDVREVIARVLDKDSLLEVQPLWGKSLVVGFARLGGRSVGVVANQATELEGRLDVDAATKGARFVRLCDAFNLPLVTIVDTPGFAQAEAQGRLVVAGAKLMYAFAEATVPKLSLIIGRAAGEGFAVMSPKGLRADFCCAWPSASLSAAAGEDAQRSSEALYAAAKAGQLDDIIEPVTSRPRLVAALEACIYKRESRPAKKHGNIPL